METSVTSRRRWLRLKSFIALAGPVLVLASILIAGTPGSPDDTTADIEFGQIDFTHNMVNFGGRTALSLPAAVAVDSVGHLYVADTNNNRVLGWSDAASFTNGAPADLVIGQPDFYTANPNDGTMEGNVNGEGPDSLNLPMAVGVDAQKNLYVVDYFNNRALEYTAPFAACGSFPCVGAPANLVFGTCGAGFTGNNCSGTSADSLAGPKGVAFDSNGNVYIGDSGEGRVLEYDNPLAPGGGTPGTPGAAGDTTADLVFGRDGSFTTANCNGGTEDGDVDGVGPDTLCQPEGIALDSSNNLYIADSDNNRVLEITDPTAGNPSPSTVFSASLVFGQDGSFTSVSCDDGTDPDNVFGLGPDSLCGPQGVAVDTLGNVYVADSQNFRVLEYNTPLNSGSGEPGAGDTIADQVFGQDGSFTTVSSNAGTDAGDVNGLGPDSLFLPQGVAVDSSNNLYVADTQDNRVLEYNRVPEEETTDTSADRELGQIDSVHNITNFGGPSALSLLTAFNTLSGVAVDLSGHVYVADSFNSRVLGWHDAAALTNGAPADLLIGQPDFYTAEYGVSGPDLLFEPGGIAVDPTSENLYIADSGNNRVLEFNQPFAGFTGSPITGLSANLVFGQGGSFTARDCEDDLGEPTADNLCDPQGVALDASGNLYVSDTSNIRVLEYYAPFTGGSHSGTPGFSGDTTADVVFGACGGGFTANDCSGTSADSLSSPEGLALDASGNLYVADSINPNESQSNNRVLEYYAPFTGGSHSGTPGFRAIPPPTWSSGKAAASRRILAAP